MAWWRGLLGTLAVLALAQFAGVNTNLDRWLTDAHWRLVAAHDPTPFPDDILVVAIDDATIQKLGRLKYWSRAKYAELLDKLGEAKAVGLDILFVDPDQYDPEGDAALAEAIERQGRTVAVCYQWHETRPISAETQAELKLLESRLPQFQDSVGLDVAYLTGETLQPPLAAVTEAAAALGYSDVNADADGVYRDPQLVRGTFNLTELHQLSLAVAAVGAGQGGQSLSRGALAEVDLGGRRVPLQAGALLLQPIARRGGGLGEGLGQPVPTISFVDALTKPSDFFHDKLILVGETATGTTDIRPNPLDPGLRGVELNAEMLANLLYLDPVRPLAGGPQWLLILLAIGLPLALYSRLSPRVASAGAVLTAVVLIAVLEVCFRARLVPAWSPVLLSLLSATLIMGLQRLATEEQQKRQLRTSFSMYVAPELVEEIVDDPEIATQEGTRRQVAVLFSDIRSFTSYCEHNPPEVIVRQMREYLGSMADSVDQFHGVLDKYIGDAVMALWGPFLPDDSNSAALAVMSGLDMLDRLERLNEAWGAAELPLFKIGIGIHLGEAVVGNIGSARRMQYTALGDAVNLASRLESNTKELGAPFVVSEDVKAATEAVLTDHVGFRPLGTITVKNRAQPVTVYAVMRSAAGSEESQNNGR